MLGGRDVMYGGGVALIKTLPPTKRTAKRAQNMGVLGAGFLRGQPVGRQDFRAAFFLRMLSGMTMRRVSGVFLMRFPWISGLAFHE